MTPWTPELQPERTALAWGRSWLSMVVASLVVAREGLTSGAPLVAAAAVAAGLVWAGIAALVPRQYRRRTVTLVGGGLHAVMLPAVLAASATATLCLATLVLVL